MRSIPRTEILCCFLAASLGGCAVGPNYAPPPAAALAVPAQYSLAAQPGDPAGLADWWQQFNDPLLTELIARATAANLDIAVSRKHGCARRAKRWSRRARRCCRR